MQITALGNPKLLERVAAGLMAIRNMFSQFDEDMNNVITREEFIKVTSAVFAAHPSCVSDRWVLHCVTHSTALKLRHLIFPCSWYTAGHLRHKQYQAVRLSAGLSGDVHRCNA